MQPMKMKYGLVVASLTMFTLWLAYPRTALGQQTTVGVVQPDAGWQPASQLTRFDLDFPGGTPKELVAAIQKSMSKPLNVIIPDPFADTKIPALKMKNVDVPQLFRA